MQVVWELPAGMATEQLPPRERGSLAQGVERLAAEWASRSEDLKVLGSGSAGSVYSLRVGGDLRVIVTRRAGKLVVLDVVKNSQIEKLRTAMKGRN